jgi:hypothetical protein
MRRRNSVEPVIGHLKLDGRMRRCFLKGVLGDAVNVLLCACGHNLRMLLSWLYFALKKYGLILHYLLCLVLSGLGKGKTKMVPAC